MDLGAGRCCYPYLGLAIFFVFCLLMLFVFMSGERTRGCCLFLCWGLLFCASGVLAGLLSSFEGW